MKKLLLIVAVFACFAACEEESLSPPEIRPDLSPIPVGTHYTDADPYVFNLMIQNRGEQTLVISSVVARGDQNCAFTWEGPAEAELEYNDSTFIKGTYDPSVAGEDQVALEITSNAENFPLLEIPVCGKAVAPGDDMGEDITCDLPPSDQEDCEE